MRGICSLASGLRLVTAALLILGSAPAAGVLIANEDGDATNSSQGFFGWDYVGDVDGKSATYLGQGWVLTANHVGPGDFTLGGVVYPWVAGSDVRLETTATKPADLVMFRVSPQPPGLEPLALRADEPVLGEFTLMIGCGRDRGGAITWDPNGPFPPELVGGWEWLSTNSKRWGTNEVDGFPFGTIRDTVAFYTVFDPYDVSPSIAAAQGVSGDSGGAVFTVRAEQGTELAGIIYAIGDSPGQPSATSIYTNLTFVARLDFYRDQIEEVISMPEPRWGLPWGAGLLAALARRRRR